MKVGANIPALQAYSALSKTNLKLEGSSKRLSTGIKINSAVDDPAGLAISTKLKMQIDGLTKANQNASNAISLVQTADVALGEVQEMLQRVRELTVRAASDTYTLEDRKMMQLEIDELVKEIDDTAYKSEYNKIKLLNGEASGLVYKYTIESAATTATFNTGMPSVDVTLSPKIEGSMILQSTFKNPDNSITTNEIEVVFDGTETAEDVFNKLNSAASTIGLDFAGVIPETMTINQKNIGDEWGIGISGDSSVLKALGLGNQGGGNYDPALSASETAAYFGGIPASKILQIPQLIGNIQINGVNVNFDGTESVTQITNKITSAAATADITLTGDIPGVATFETNSTGSSFVIEFNGDKHILDALGLTKFSGGVYTRGKDNGVNLITQAEDPTSPLSLNAKITPIGGATTVSYIITDNVNTASGTAVYSLNQRTTIDPNLKSREIGVFASMTSKPLTIQVGPNKDMEMSVPIEKISAEILGLDKVNVTNHFFADKSLVYCDEALSKLSHMRSQIGAFQNRLEFTVTSLEAAELNTTESLSRFLDTDVAYEMSEYTKLNVISQAGMSVLAQANQRPQMVLQLLQK